MVHLQQHYLTLDHAIDLTKDARNYQTKTWPSTKQANCGERTFEAQMLLLEEYTLRLRRVWNETQSYVDDGDVPNVLGRKRIEKYAAIVANIALWAVQSATGETVVDDGQTPPPAETDPVVWQSAS